MDAGQVDGQPAARQAHLHRLLVRLQAADARFEARWDDLDLIADAELPVAQRAGDHRAEAGHGEHAIDGQARLALIAAGRHLASTSANACLRVDSPAPVRAETGTMGARPRQVPRSVSRRSASTRSSQPSSVMASIFVRATTPAGT